MYSGYIPKRVRLLCDLTTYDKRLVVGSLGHTTGRDGQWGSMISYDCGAYLDTIYTSLEEVDDACPGPDDPAGYRQWKDDRLRKATDVRVQLGPRGGFRSLSYKVGDQCVEFYDKWWASQEIEQLRAVGTPVAEAAPDDVFPIGNNHPR